MTIRPVDLNGMIQRTQDVGRVKQDEDYKPVLDQQNIQTIVTKEEDRNSRQVIQADNAKKEEFRYDAKEKGQSGSESNRKNNKKREDKDNPGKVIVKDKSVGFDIKI